MDLKDLGVFTLDFEPHEVEQGKELIKAAINAASAHVAPSAPTISARAPKALTWCVEKYCAEQLKIGNWKAATAADIRGDLGQFVAIVGDQSIGELNKARLVEAKDTWLSLPANINKQSKFKGLSVSVILALGLPPQSAVNVSKKFERVKAFLTWAKSNDYVDNNVATDIRINAKGGSFEKFSPSDLRSLFQSPEYTKHEFAETHQYWLPLIALFTGARLEEICQLHISDIRDSADGPFFHITLESDDDTIGHTKQLKTEASNRTCPVHPELIALGFLSYVAELKTQGCAQLFPELRPEASGKMGARASEWFTTYRRKCGVGALAGRSRKVFHSFRHTMNAELQKLGVAQEIRELLCGHKSASVNVAVYGSKELDHRLVEAIHKLNYGIAFVPFKPKVSHEQARVKGSRH